VLVIVLLAAGLSATVSVAPASAALPGAELVWSPMVPASSETTRSAAAACPAGKRVVGTFAFTSGAPRDVVITALIPTGAGAIGLAREDQDGTAANWSLTVQIVCAAPIAGLTTVSTLSATNSSNKQVTVSCPAGTKLYASGWNLTDSGGQVLLNQVSQAADLTSVSITGMEDQDGYAADWRLTTYGICAQWLPGLALTTATSPIDSSDKSVLLVCGPDQRRLTAGWSLIGTGSSPAGQVLAQPGSSGTNWYELIAIEDDDGFTGTWYATARVICVTV
jgi:hypothetical protein